MLNMRIETIGDCTLYNGDCLEVMAGLPENSVDAIVTDPPYHLHSITKRFAKTGRTESTKTKSGPHQRTATGFMGQVWDGGDIAFRVETWAACLRVLKPGGYILAFASTRGFGRMSVAIEDAGFITHPFVAWLFGSGFPKATQTKVEGMEGWRYGGQALKPAIEPIYMGQKPFSEKTGTANIRRWGTGAINLDGCRVDGNPAPWGTHTEGSGGYRLHKRGTVAPPATNGRWPANLIHDGSGEVLQAFPHTTSGTFSGHRNEPKTKNTFGKFDLRDEVGHVGDSGSAARFFYCAKASRKDREEGLDASAKSAGGMVSNTSGQHITRRDEGYSPEPRANVHPTVKPTALMEYLVRLVTPPNGTVLDPFMGSGSTGKAAVFEKLKFIGVEREEKYLDIAAARIAWAADYHELPVAAQAQPANDNAPDLFSHTGAA